MPKRIRSASPDVIVAVGKRITRFVYNMIRMIRQKKITSLINTHFLSIITLYINKLGNGDNAEEFKCYRIALAHACPYFDGEHHKLYQCVYYYLYT